MNIKEILARWSPWHLRRRIAELEQKAVEYGESLERLAALQILKNLEMAPKNRARESVSLQNIPEGHDGYIIFLLDNGLIACDEEAQAHRLLERCPLPIPKIVHSIFKGK